MQAIRNSINAKPEPHRCCGRITTKWKGQGNYKSGRQVYCKQCQKSYDYDTGKPRASAWWMAIDKKHAWWMVIDKKHVRRSI